MTDAALGYLLSAAALLLFTAGTLVTRSASARLELGLGFLIATAVNVLFAGAVLLVQLALREKAVRWNGGAFALFALAGVFTTYLGRWFFYESVVRFGPAKASIFQVSSPLFTALIAWPLLGERLSWPVVAGMALTVGGLILVSAKPGGGTVHRPAPARGGTVRVRLLESVLLLGLCSSLAYAVGNVLRGSGIRRWNEPVLGALVGAVCGLALYLIFMPGKHALRGRLRAAFHHSRHGVALYALMGVTTISAQMCSIASMRYIPLSVATLVTLCTPLLVFPLSHWLFKKQEELTRVALAGSGLTLVGIAMIVMR